MTITIEQAAHSISESLCQEFCWPQTADRGVVIAAGKVSVSAVYPTSRMRTIAAMCGINITVFWKSTF